MIQITSDSSSEGIRSSETVTENFTSPFRTLHLEFPSKNNDKLIYH